MGMGKTETTSDTTIPGMSAMARRMEDLIGEAATGAAGQLNQEISTDATPQQLEQIRLMQESTGALARSQMEAGLRDTMGTVEGAALARGVEGSSIESVMQAINAQDMQRQMNEMIIQGQGQAAEQGINSGFANANLQLNRNQQLLQTLLGGGGAVMQGDLQSRMAQGSNVGTTDKGNFGAMMQLGQTAGSIIPG